MERPDNWMDRAACRPDPSWSMEQRRAHTSLFFPDRGQSQRAGLRFCERCVVTDKCAIYADMNDEAYGMWNGVLRSRGNHKDQPDNNNEEQFVIPRSLSASSIQTYLGCPARWRAEYIEFGRMPGGDAASIGTVCHGTFEVWVADGHHTKNYPDAWPVMKGIYDEQYWRLFGDAARYEDGVDMCKKWLKRQDWSGREVLTTESKESIEIPTGAGPIKFNYIMDRLDRLDSGDIEVVDYKSLSQPVQPQDLKGKPQARLYALMAQMKYPEANRIWVTFDMLRFDQPVGIVFTKEENRATWKWLCEIAQRIVNDDTAEERLNDDCRWCIRKSVCSSLQKHIAVGGPLGITDAADAARKLHDIDRAAKALAVHQRELEAFLLAEMERQDEIEAEFGGLAVKVTVSSRRGIDEGRLRPIIGDELMAKYGAMTMGKLDELIKSDDIDDQTKAAVRQLIQRNFGDPKIKIEAAS